MAVSMLITHHTHIAPFIEYLRFEKRYSQHTCISYATDLEQFSNFIKKAYDDEPLDKVTASFIRSWLAQMKENKISSKTINRKISALKSFFRFLIKQGVINQTPMATISSPKTNKRLPVFVKEQHTETLLNHLEFSNNWQGRTEKLIIELLYNTGMRLSELINLKEGQVDIGYAQLKVLGKGNKERILPLSHQLLAEIQDYIKNKPIKHESINELLVNEKGKPLYPKYVYRTVKKYLSLVTTLEKKSPHILRHTFATHLMNNGAELNDVKELLGHSSLASTQVYTHTTLEKLKEIHKRAHPKA